MCIRDRNVVGGVNIRVDPIIDSAWIQTTQHVSDEQNKLINAQTDMVPSGRNYQIWSLTTLYKLHVKFVLVLIHTTHQIVKN